MNASVTITNAYAIPERSNDLCQVSFINSDVNIVKKVKSKNLTIGNFTNNSRMVNNNIIKKVKIREVFLLNLKTPKEEKKRMYR